MEEKEGKTSSKIDWVPKTELGRKVASGQITNIDEILLRGEKILEHEIVDFLLPGIQEELILIGTTQRVTDSGRKVKFRA
ncbi:MAG: hypothetical protein ACPL0A_03095, partial [Candidatus Micrarchaeia archaeon]